MTDSSKIDSVPDETPIDISQLKMKGIATRGELSVLEAANIRKVVVKYLGKRVTKRTAPFTFAWVLSLHKEMFGDVWGWAGVTRQHDLTIGVPWSQIEPQLYELLKNLPFWNENGVDLQEQAVMLHHRAVQIHPFENGNGRWARMLANIWLRLQKAPIVEWPDEVTGAVSVIRREYILAVKAGDNGDYGPLTELHVRFTPS